MHGICPLTAWAIYHKRAVHTSLIFKLSKFQDQFHYLTVIEIKDYYKYFDKVPNTEKLGKKERTQTFR